jgi:hypothetical protein
MFRGELHIFCEPTTLDEYDSIDIAKKYKIISLEVHNQVKKEKKYEQQYRRVGLGHQCLPRGLDANHSG